MHSHIAELLRHLGGQHPETPGVVAAVEVAEPSEEGQKSLIGDDSSSRPERGIGVGCSLRGRDDSVGLPDCDVLAFETAGVAFGRERLAVTEAHGLSKTCLPYEVSCGHTHRPCCWLALDNNLIQKLQLQPLTLRLRWETCHTANALMTGLCKVASN